MNWHQRFAAATQDERDLVVQLLLERIEKRQNQTWLINTILIRDRRRRHAHFVGEHLHAMRARRIYLMSFAMILLTISVAAWLIALNVPSEMGGLIVALYDTIILTIIARRPYRLQTSNH